MAASAKKLAQLYGMSEEDCLKMEIAGNLYDLGKLVVPNEILEKPGKRYFDSLKDKESGTRALQ